MNKYTIQLIVATALVAVPIAARAQGETEARCGVDSLDPAQATARLEWARMCALTLNTGTVPNSGDPDNWFTTDDYPDTPEYLDNNNFSRAFTGETEFYHVNEEHAKRLYQGGTYTPVKETSGPTAGFWKWQRPPTKLRARPLYPTFDSSTGSVLIATNLAECKLYEKNLNTNVISTIPWTGGFRVAAYCVSSCYAPDQNLRFSGGDVNVVVAMKARRDDLVTLTPGASLDDLSLQTSRVASYTTEIRDAENVIYKLTTASGGSLKVTNEHPMITSSGRLVQAQQLAVGNELLKADGTPDPIIGIEKTTYFGRVYNIKPVSTEPVANILIAQGYLVGSSRFQNDDVSYMNRILLLHQVPDEVMPR